MRYNLGVRAALWMLVWYTAASVVTFVAFWRDKRAAGRGTRRTPEAVLHTMELLGGWPGALAGMRWIRHKNRKGPYVAVLAAIILLHALVWAGAAWLVLRSGD